MLALLLLALALAMDAFAVSLARGAAGEHRIARALETGLAFGVAQGVMPYLGWLLGTAFLSYVEAVDHWIAFALLAFLGGRMIREGLSGEEEAELEARSRRSHYAALTIAAIATSIDAAAAGLTLEVMGMPVLLACLVIGLVTAALCVPAYWFASAIGPRLGRYAEIGGGVVLIGLGVRILVEHLS